METHSRCEPSPTFAVPARPAHPPDAVPVPAGAPKWVTPALIAKTIRVWRPYSDRPLTAEDALEMILNVGLLFDTLGQGAMA